MGFMDSINDRLDNLKSRSRPSGLMSSSTGGIAGGKHGVLSFENDMIISKPAIVFYTSQVFFNFLAMACMASVASFQAKWKVGPSGLSAFALFISIAGICLSLFMLVVPIVYEKRDKFSRAARALQEFRVAAILTGTGTSASLLIAFIVTISVFTQAGCKNASSDPHASLGSVFRSGLSGWCSTKKAAAVFFWFAFGFWVASLCLLIMNWRSGKLSGPRDPPFVHPSDDLEYEEESGDAHSGYHMVQENRGSTYDDATSVPYSLPPMSFSSTVSPPTQPEYAPPTNSRPSMDVYGAFSDPPPTGYTGASSRATPSPQQSQPDVSISRTMQYADPYAAVRTSINPGTPQRVDPPHDPPRYSFEGRY